jgi:hypothetical protein
VWIHFWLIGSIDTIDILCVLVKGRVAILYGVVTLFLFMCMGTPSYNRDNRYNYTLLVNILVYFSYYLR